MLRHLAPAILTALLPVLVLAADAPKPQDITGRVLDASQKPIASADITLCRTATAGPDLQGTIVAKAKSAPDGTFSFPAAATWTSPDVRYTLVAQDADHGVGFLSILNAKPTADLALPITGKTLLKATVVDTANHPVKGARVSLVQARPNTQPFHSEDYLILGWSEAIASTTDEKGQAQLAVPPNLQYHIAATQPGFARAFAQDPADPQTLVLCPGGTIKGTVTYSDGKPAANARVVYTYSGGTMPFMAYAVTDSAGQYTLTDVAAQGYRSTVDAPADEDPFANVGKVAADDAAAAADISSSASVSVDVQPNATATANIVLKRNLEVSGTVTDDTTGKPLPGVNVFAHVYGDGIMSNPHPAMTTDKDGRFRTSAPHGANIQITIQSSPGVLLDENDGQDRYTNLQSISAPQTNLSFHVHTIPTHSITGQLTGPDGKPVAGTINVSLQVPAVNAAADGTFTLPTVPSDRPCSLYAIAGNSGAILTLKPDQQKLTIPLQPLLDREFLATTASGKPVSGITVNANPRSSTNGYLPISISSLPTNAEGKTTLKGLIPAASYNLSWNSPQDRNFGQNNTEFLASASAEPFKLTVKEYTNTLTGTVVDSKGKPIAGVHLQFQSTESFRNEDWGRAQGTATKADGAFKFTNLANGTLEGEIYAPNYRQTSFAVPTNASDVKITLRTQQEPAVHEVVVLDEQNKPVADAPVIIVYREPNTNSSLQEAANTDANGLVDLTDIPSQQGISVICDREGYNLAAAQCEQYRDGRQLIRLTPALPPRQIRVVDDNGKPLANLTVKITSFSTSTSAYNNRSAQTYLWPNELLTSVGMSQKTSADGRATFPRLSYKQSANASIESPIYGHRNINLQPAAADTPTEIQLRLPGSLSGKVTAPEGVKLSLNQYHVQMRPVNSGEFYQSDVRPDGSFAIQKIAPGSYAVSLETWNQNAATRRYKLPNPPTVAIESNKDAALALELKEGVRIRGRLATTPKNGQPDSVYLLDSNHSLQNLNSDAKGNFEVYVPGPGTYTFYAQTDNNQGLHPLPPVNVPTTQPIDDLVLKP